MSRLPEGWIAADLMSLVELHDSRRVPLNQKQRSERQGAYAYYGANGQVDSINDYLFDGDYVLLAEDGGYFNDPTRSVAYEVSGKFWLNNHAHILSPRGGISTQFLAHCLNTFDWMPYVGGSTRLKLTQEGMRRVKINLPPLAEQKRIVAKLDRLFSRSQSAREELARIPKLIDRYKQAILTAACSGHFLDKSHKDKSQWQSTTLANIITGKPRNGYSPKPATYPTEVKSLTLSATTSSKFKSQYFKYIDEKIDSQSHLWLTPGDILIQRSNSLDYVGTSAIYTGGVSEFIYPDLMMKVQVDERKAISEFLHYVLCEASTRNYFKENATGTAGNMPKINQQTVMNVPINLPPLNEQEKIVQRVQMIFNATDLIQQEYQKAIARLEQLDRAILSKAFQGELVPQDPNDEPASVLLDRIRAEEQTQPTTRKVRTSKT